jgi:hypothetical protein
MYKSSTYLVVTYFPTYFLQELVTKVKPNINSVEGSSNGHPMDGALVGCWFTVLWPKCPTMRQREQRTRDPLPLLPRTHHVLIALLVLYRRIPLLPRTHQVLIALLVLHRRIPLLPRTHQVLHRFVSSAPSDVNSTPNWTKLDHRIVKRTTMGAWWKWKWSWKGREKSCVQQKEQSISVQHTSYFFLQFEGPSIGKVAIRNRDL